MPLLDGLAQGSADAPSIWLPLIVIGLIWWFLLFRPQRQQDKRHREMLAALKPGDKVITTGGLYGVITQAQTGDKTVRLKVADNLRLEVARSAITGFQPSDAAADPDKKGS